MKIGRRLAIKILNASKFALSFASGSDVTLDPALVTEPIDRAMLAGLADVIDSATKELERYDHTRALEVTETFFWAFCDDYLELVKDRAYADGATEVGADAVSARVALLLALDSLLRLFAPVLPFATEEVWSWWHDESIHTAPWPTSAALRDAAGDARLSGLTNPGHALAVLRKLKSEAKASMKTPILAAELQILETAVAEVTAALGDIKAAGRVTGEITFVPVAQSDDDSHGGLTVLSHELGEAPAKTPRK